MGYTQKLGKVWKSMKINKNKEKVSGEWGKIRSFECLVLSFWARPASLLNYAEVCARLRAGVNFVAK
jgi:hypothetical protein